MSRNGKWDKKSKHGKWTILNKIQQNPGKTKYFITGMNSRGYKNIQELIEDHCIRSEYRQGIYSLYITRKGIREMEKRVTE